MLELWGMIAALSAAEQRGCGQTAVEREEAFYARFREPFWQRLSRHWTALRQGYAASRHAAVESEKGAVPSSTAAKREPPRHKRHGPAQDQCCGHGRPSSAIAG